MISKFNTLFLIQVSAGEGSIVLQVCGHQALHHSRLHDWGPSCAWERSVNRSGIQDGVGDRDRPRYLQGDVRLDQQAPWHH